MTYGLLETFLLAGASHMLCLYQNQEKTHKKPYKLLSYCSYQLCLQVHGTHDQQQTHVVPGKKQNYHTCTVWFPQRSKYHRPARTFGVLSERLLLRSSMLLLFSLISKRLTIQHGSFKKFTWCWSARPTATFRSQLSLWQKVPSQSWWMLLQTLRTGNGHTSRICYTILSEN